MEEKKLTRADLVRIANKVYNMIMDEVTDDEGVGYPFDMMAVLAITHRIGFAAIERIRGIDVARELTGGLIELLKVTMEEGAWDEINQKVK